MADPAKAQFINPPNNLNKAISRDGTGVTPDEAISRAEEALTEFEKDFTGWAKEYLDELDAALAEARAKPEEQETHIQRIFVQAMDLKGQGGSFGYNLITAIGDSLKKFTEGRSEAKPRDVEIIAAHVDAIRVVIAQDIKGDGGEVGRQIVESLYKLTAK